MITVTLFEDKSAFIAGDNFASFSSTKVEFTNKLIESWALCGFVLEVSRPDCAVNAIWNLER